MDSFKDVLEAAQAYCKTQMAEPTYNLYIDGLEPISFEDSSHITLSVRNDFICKIVTDRYLGFNIALLINKTAIYTSNEITELGIFLNDSSAQ